MIIDVIVPVFNSRKYAEKLLHSIDLLELDGIYINVIIVDDASDSDVRCYLERFVLDRSNFELLVNEENRGYTRSVCRGLRESNAEFCAVINSDCELSPKSISKLLRWLRKDELLFGVSPLSNAASWQSVPKVIDSATNAMAVNNKPEGFTLDQVDRLCEIYNSGLAVGQLLNGFCVLYRRSLLELVGFPDEHAFPRGYGEEDDLHLRAVNNGYKLGVATDTYVYHHKTKSFSSSEKTELSRLGRQKLNERYGDSRIKRAAISMRYHPRLISMRNVFDHLFDKHIEPLKSYLDIDWTEQKEKDRTKGLTTIVMPLCAKGAMSYDAIESIEKNTIGEFELIVVSNGSDDECMSYLEKAKQEFNFTLVRLDSNLNFSMGCNIGFIYGSGDRVVFVNNDMLFSDPHWLEGISEPLSDDDVGAVGIKLVYEDLTVQSAGLVWVDESNFPIDINRGKQFDEVYGIAEFSGITGACFAMRSSEFASLKGFDPLYINGSEDLDLCMKICLTLRKKCILNADVYAIHLESKSPGRSLFIDKNRKHFFLRWSGLVRAITTDFGDDFRFKEIDNFPKPLRMVRIF